LNLLSHKHEVNTLHHNIQCGFGKEVCDGRIGHKTISPTDFGIVPGMLVTIM